MYYYLENGDIIEEGDEYWSANLNCYQKSLNAIGKIYNSEEHYKMRRKIKHYKMRRKIKTIRDKLIEVF